MRWRPAPGRCYALGYDVAEPITFANLMTMFTMGTTPPGNDPMLNGASDAPAMTRATSALQ
jgi:hypothetical protein